MILITCIIIFSLSLKFMSKENIRKFREEVKEGGSKHSKNLPPHITTLDASKHKPQATN
jgi:hypothetical protein